MGKGKLDRAPSNSARRRRAARRRAKEKHLSIHPENRPPLNIGCSEEETSHNKIGRYGLHTLIEIVVLLILGGLLITYYSTQV